MLRFLMFVSLLFGTVTPAWSADPHAHHGHATAHVKVVNGIQVAFDLTTLVAHQKMMQQMKMGAMKHPAGATHAAVITLMDAKSKKLITDAAAKIKVIGPDQKPVGNPAGEPLQVMKGSGMHHYGAAFKLAKPGTYQVVVMFKAHGKVHTVGTPWVVGQ